MKNTLGTAFIFMNNITKQMESITVYVLLIIASEEEENCLKTMKFR